MRILKGKAGQDASRLLSITLLVLQASLSRLTRRMLTDKIGESHIGVSPII